MAQAMEQLAHARSHPGFNRNTGSTTPTRAPVPVAFSNRGLCRSGVGLIRLACFSVAVSSLNACSGPFDEVEAAVRENLRDPESARFSDLRRCGDSKVYAGQVNSKNAYGGYTGKQLFYYSDYKVEIGDDVLSGSLFRECLVATNAETARIYRSLGKEREAREAEASSANVAASPMADVDAAVDQATSRPSSKPAVAEDENEVPVCDRPDSPSKRALMNEIGTDCLGE